MSKRKLLPIAFLVASALIGASCSKTVNVDEERRSENEAAFRAFADSAGFQRVVTPGIAGTAAVYMRVTKPSGSQITPDYTDEVHLFRDVYRTTDWQRSGSQAPRILQTLSSSAVTSESVGRLKLGLQMAVQQLHEGDEADIVIPWYLNNNNSAQERTETYISLYYKVRLARVIKPVEN